MEEKVEVSWTKRAIILNLILIPITLYWGAISNNFSNRPGTYQSIFLPFIYIVIVSEILGRISPKLRLRPCEYVLIFPAFLASGAVKYFSKGYSGGHHIYTMWNTWIVQNIFGLTDPVYASFWQAHMPTIFPKDPEVIDVILHGIGPGRVFSWGPWIPAIIYWSAILIFYDFINISLAWGIFAYPWVELERLIFPLQVPATYTFKETVPEPGTNTGRLFNFKSPTTRLYWIGFIVGLMFSIYPLIYEVMPEMAYQALGRFAWGEIRWSLPIAYVVPGVYSSVIIQPDLMVLFLLVPTDTLLSATLLWLIFYAIYPAIAIRLGLAPYNPGMEFQGGPYWNFLPARQGAFPFGWMTPGVVFAVALWNIWRYRSRLVTLGQVLLGKKELMDGDLPLRLPLLILIIGIIGYIATGASIGVPVHILILFLCFGIAWDIMYGRHTSWDAWHVGDISYGAMGSGLFYSIGVQMGAWPATWPNPSETWFRTLFATNIGGSDLTWWSRTSGLGMISACNLYKMAHDTATSKKATYLTYILTLIIAIPLTGIIRLYILAHGGGIENSASMGTVPPSGKWNHFVNSNPLPISFGDLWKWSAVGFVFTIIVYLLRTKFPWFFLNPDCFFGVLIIPDWLWFMCFVALIIKLLLIKILGAERFIRYITPIVSGACIGFGVTFLPAGLYNFFTATLPNFYAHFTP